MKYHFEKVLAAPDESFRAVIEDGPVIDCVFHVHPEIELTWVESSFGCRFIGESIEPFFENDLVLIGGMVPHHFFNRADDGSGPQWSRLRVMKFRREFCGTGFLELPETAGIRALLDETPAGLAFPPETATRAAELIRRLFTQKGLARLLTFLELLELLAASPRRKLNPGPAVAEGQEPDARLNRILGYIHRRLESGHEVTLGEAAATACLTAPAFSSYFRRATRKRFIDYVTEFKLNRAALLLVRSDRAVVDIALASGFGNLSNFNRRFLASKGMTPREYRRRFRIPAL